MPQRTRKTSIDKRGDTNLTKLAAYVAFLLAAVQYAPIGFFSDWSTGGYEAGNCFTSGKYVKTVVKIMSVNEEDGATFIKYAYVDESVYGEKTRDRSSFVEMYAKRVRCSVFDDTQVEYKLSRLDDKVKMLENGMTGLNEAVTKLELGKRR